MDYETTLIVDAQLDEGAIGGEIEKTESLISKMGELKNTEKLGKRRLAYPIKKKTHGYYVYLTFQGDNKLIQEMEYGFRFNENVLRYLTVRQ